MNVSEYARYDGLGLAELVRRREVKSAELVELALAAIGQVNPELNAVVQILADQARRSAAKGVAEGPFAGVPFVVKEEVCHMAGVPLNMGSRLTKGLTLPYDSELMTRFREAGLIPVGTTTLPELGFGPTAEAVLYGPTHNPWKRGYSAGGSSGGSAAAVAAGVTPVAYGNDGGGSIRIPASCCGLVGLKPTRGRVPTGPDNGELLSGLGVEFALTRSVRDSAALLDAVAGPDPGCYAWAERPGRPWLEEVMAPPGRLRIAWMEKPLTGAPVDSECISILRDTVKLCEELGHELVEAAPEIDVEAHDAATLTIWCANMAHGIDRMAALLDRRIGPETLESATLASYEHGRQIRATGLLAAIEAYTAASRATGRFFETIDVLLSPVCDRPAPLHGEIDQNAPGITAEQWVSKIFGYAAFTALFNTTGQPAISLPLGWTAGGLPVGMQFAGRFADEATLFRLAGQLERARPWSEHRPPTYVG